jgi:hypothetical protein
VFVSLFVHGEPLLALLILESKAGTLFTPAHKLVEALVVYGGRFVKFLTLPNFMFDELNVAKNEFIALFLRF